MARGRKSQIVAAEEAAMIILDTDLFTLAQHPDSESAIRLRARVAQIPREERLATTVITYEEQTRGWLALMAKAKDSARLVAAYNRLSHHLETYSKVLVVRFTDEAAVEYDRLRSLRLRVGSMDL